MPAPRSRTVRSFRALLAGALLAGLAAAAVAPGGAGAAAVDAGAPRVTSANGAEIAAPFASAAGGAAARLAAVARAGEASAIAGRNTTGGRDGVGSELLRRTSDLPISTPYGVVVDTARSRVYISGGDRIVVTDLDGAQQQVVDMPGALGMAMVGGVLYVAQISTGSIVRMNLGPTVSIGTPLATGLDMPRELVAAAGALWVGTGGCLTLGQTIVRVALDTGATTPLAAAPAMRCPSLAASASTLVAGERSGNPTTVHVFDVGADPPTRTTTGGSATGDPAEPVGAMADLAIGAAGSTLYTANGTPRRGLSWSLPALTPGTDYVADANPSAVATTDASGGLVAVGLSQAPAPGPTLLLFDRANGAAPRWSLRLGETVHPHGLAFSADGTRVYAVSRATDGRVELHVIDVADPHTVPTTTPPPTTAPPTTAPPTTAPPAASQFGEFHALAPRRVFDSRGGAPVAEGSVQITGKGGVPAGGVSAVAVNVTVTEPAAEGYLSVFPAGQPRPNASTLNYRPGQTVPNMAIVGVGPAGELGLYALTPTHVIIDVVGWFGTATAPSGTRFHPLAPFRWFDTRTGRRGDGSIRPVGPGQWVFASATGGETAQAAGVTAVAMNVTAANTTESSYLTVTPYGAPLGSSNLNWTAGEIVPNAVISKVDDTAGRVQFTNHTGSTDVIVDSSGYWDAGTTANGLRFTPIAPTRMADTRTGALAPGSVLGQVLRLGPGEFVSFKANGQLPAGATTAVLNVTAVNPSTDGFLSVFPLGLPYAEGITTSVVNFTAGAVRPNMAIMPMGAGGEIVVVNGGGGTVDVVVDMTGYFAP